MADRKRHVLRSRLRRQRASAWSASTAPAGLCCICRRGPIDVAVSSGSPHRFDPTAALGLIDVAGLRLEALYGGFAGEPLADDSHEYVFVARRSC
jgi:hypothetical protein